MKLDWHSIQKEIKTKNQHQKWTNLKRDVQDFVAAAERKHILSSWKYNVGMKENCSEKNVGYCRVVASSSRTVREWQG